MRFYGRGRPTEMDSEFDAEPTTSVNSSRNRLTAKVMLGSDWYAHSDPVPRYLVICEYSDYMEVKCSFIRGFRNRNTPLQKET